MERQKDLVLSASLRVGDKGVAYTPADAAYGSNPRHEDGERPDDQWMQQHTHLTRLVGGAAIPLTLLAQRARATTANAGRIHDAQTALGLCAPLMGAKLQACGTVQGAIGLEDKVSPREAARFPGQSDFCRSVPLNRSLRGGLLVRRWERGSKFAGAHLSWLKHMTQLQSEVPEPLRDDLPSLLTVCRMADPTVGVLFLVADQLKHSQTRHDADTAPRHHWR